MKEIITTTRNKIIRIGYKTIAKPLFFHHDPEEVHERITKLGNFLGNHTITRLSTRLAFNYQNPILEQTIKGIHFKNPIGLPGGFDKNALLTNIIPEVGFGFMEIGSVTAKPCPGNPKPRLWRLKESKSLVVYYGLMNDGCEIIKKRLENKTFKIPLGINIAKTNCKETVDLEQGINDYTVSYKTLKDLPDYITINISCPNAYGGEPFTNPKKLDLLLKELEKYPTEKPIFLKLSPDLSLDEVDELLKIINKHKISGLISTNLTKNRNNPNIIESNIPHKGGISGPVVRDLSTSQIAYLYKKTKGKYVIIGAGGISSSKDAYEKIKAGASLLQLITSMIFEGPQVVSEINQGLVKLLKQDKYKNISEAVGMKIRN